jgi:hypothetical protein
MDKLILLLLILALAGCCKKPINKKVVDSVTVRRIERTKTIKGPPESIKINQLIECDSITNKPKPAKTTQTGPGLTITTAIDTTGVLSIECNTDSLKRVIKELETVINKTESTEKKPVHLVKWYDKTARAISIILILFIILYVVVKLKPF